MGVQIEILRDAASPVPFPTNMPIFVSSTGFPDPTDPTSYDFVTSNNMVNIPPDGGAGYLQGILNGGLTFAVGDPTNIPVQFDLFIDVITTNDNGNELTILSNLDYTLAPWYRYETGTSMATPAVSGVLALMQDFFTNRLHDPSPSPALMKALLVNGARLTAGYQFSVTNTTEPGGLGLGRTAQLDSGGADECARDADKHADVLCGPKPDEPAGDGRQPDLSHLRADPRRAITAIAADPGLDGSTGQSGGGDQAGEPTGDWW